MADNNEPKQVQETSALGHPRVFRIGRKTYALGLFWQVAADAAAAGREAKELASRKGTDADLYVVRVIDDNGQFGLTRSADAVPPRAVAAAAVIADYQRGSWIGVFPLGDGWWFVACRDDMILPDGDRFYSNEAEARDRFETSFAEGGWDHIYVPEGWHENAEKLPIEKILMPANGPRLIETNPFAARIKSILIIGGAVLFLGGGSIIFALWGGDENPDVVRSDLHDKVQQVTVEQSKQVTPPWYVIPATSEFLDACVSGMTEIDPNVPGWNLDRIVCRKRAVSYRWERGNGSVSWFATWMSEQGDYDPSYDIAGKDATVSVKLERQKSRGPEGIHTATEVTRHLLALAQSTETGTKLGIPRVPTRPVDAPDDWTPPDYAPMKFEITTPDLSAWRGVLSNIPGLLIDEIVFSADKGTYQVTGDIYVRV